MLTTAIVRHTPTLPLPHIQLNQYHLVLLSGLVLSPLCTTSHIVLKDILLSLQQSCHRQWAQRISSMDLQSFWLPSTTTSDVKISSFNEWTSVHHHSVCSFCPSTLEDTITVHTVALLRPLRGLRFYFSYTLRPSNRHYFPSKSFSPSSQIQNSLGKKNLICGVHGQWTLLWSRRID